MFHISSVLFGYLIQPVQLFKHGDLYVYLCKTKQKWRANIYSDNPVYGPMFSYLSRLHFPLPIIDSEAMALHN